MKCIQIRHVFAALAMSGIAIVYILRVNLNVVIIEMVNSTIFKPKNITPECPTSDIGNNSSPVTNHGTFMWTEFEQSLVLSSFYWGYVIMQIPCGFLTIKYSAKWIYALSSLMTVILTFLTPVVANLGLYPLLALRFLMGLFEGPTYPSLTNMCSKWVLESESTVIMTFINAGSSVGTIIGQVLAGFIAQYFGWETVFYVTGSIGVVWFILFSIFTSDSPRNNKFISSEERQVLVTKIVTNHDNYKPSFSKIPILDVIRSKPVLSLLVINMTYNYTWYTIINCLPYYIGEVLGFNISSNGVISSAPYIVIIATSLLSSFIFDLISPKHLLSKTKMRKLFICLGMFAGSLSEAAIVLTGCNVSAAIFLVCSTMGLMGVAISSASANYIDLAPTCAGLIMAVCNVCGSFVGIIAPYVKAYFTESGETRANWDNIFLVAASIMMFGAIVFFTFGSGSAQVWGLPPDYYGKEVIVEDMRDELSEYTEEFYKNDDDCGLLTQHAIQ